MTEEELLKNIREDLQVKRTNLSEVELERLLTTTASVIDKLLDQKGGVEIDDFGVFTRKKNESATVNLFKPYGRLKERINLR